MFSNFLRSQSSLELLHILRKTGEISSDLLAGLSCDERAYFEAELAVRKANYNGLEDRIPAGTSSWMRSFCICYRDLFTNPNKALATVKELIASCPETLELPLRLQYWNADVLYVLGDSVEGDRIINKISDSFPDDYLWKVEALIVMALGHFFAGRTNEALHAHYSCQKEIDKRPDVFFQNFNAAMATRVALKLCDANAFEFFSQKLETSLLQDNDTRYRLRHTGYRALIFNQLGEHKAAEQHWQTGDSIVDETESALERAHYLLCRGLSFALQGKAEQANEFYERSGANYHEAGAPPTFLTELEISQKLTELSNPIIRGRSLERTYQTAKSLIEEFSDKAKASNGPIRSMYEDGSTFCRELLEGTTPVERKVEFTSVSLSIIDNVSRSKTFVKGLSHFHLVPNFIAAVKQTGITEDGVANALNKVLRIKPLIDDGKYLLPNEFSSLAESPEINTILDFASTLCDLGKNADRLFTIEARLKETQRATNLLHDLRYFSSELTKLSQASTELSESRVLASRFEELIEGYLKSLRTGIAPETPGLVSTVNLFKKVSAITEKMTGKKFRISGENNSYLWISEPLVERILLNLIKNGLEAGNGEFPVEVKLARSKDSLSISVCDNGSGISPEVLESISDIAKNTAQTTKREGTGLGLRSAFECANTIGANIELVSTDSTGTCLKMVLPISKVLTNEIESNAKILIVDDSQAVRAAWLAFGVSIEQKIVAVTPEEAVFYLNDENPELQWVVLDYDMKLPNCTGATLADPIRSLGVKVALSTGYRSNELPQDARQVLWDAILSKEPQHPEEAPKVASALEPLDSDKKSPVLTLLRHDIKNELTPLKTIYRFLKNKDQTDGKTKQYIELFGKSLEAIDGIVERTLH